MKPSLHYPILQNVLFSQTFDKTVENNDMNIEN